MGTTRHPPLVRFGRKPGAPGEVLVQQASYLEPHLFATLRSTLAGRLGERELGDDGRPAAVLPLAELPSVVADLAAAGIRAELTPDLVAVIRARADAARDQVATSDARVAELRVRLAAQGEAMWSFQEAGVSWLAATPRGFLADEMGLGKGPQAILAAPDGCRFVYVTKTSLVGDILATFERWRPDLRSSILEETGFRWPHPGEALIVSYGRLPEHAPPAPDDAPLVLVADEAKALKGAKAGRSRRFRALSAAVGRIKGSHRWLLDGTPLMNRLDELYVLLEHLDLAEELYGSRRRFRELCRDDRPRFVEILRGVMLRREKEEVWPDLPRTTRQDHVVAIGDTERAALDACLLEIRRAAGERAVALYEKDCARAGEAPTSATAEQRRGAAFAQVEVAIQLAFDGQLPVPFELTSRVKSILALAKSRHAVTLLRDIAPELGPDGRVPDGERPLLFFSEHLQPVAEVVAAIPGFAAITGATPAAARTELVRRFQERELAGLAMTGETGGVGFTLTAACTAVFNDLPWNYALVSQAEDRMRRRSQEADRVHAIRVRADHVLDGRVLELITEKQELAEGTVGRTTVAGRDGAAERPGGPDATLGRVLDLATTGAARDTGPPRPPADGDERWAAHLLAAPANRTHRDLARTLAASGRLTGGQWQTVTAWANRRSTTARRQRGHRDAVTPAERAAREVLLGPSPWRPADAPVVAGLARGAGNGGLTDGEWQFAVLLTRKYLTPQPQPRREAA